jgi:hydroxypyruvate isomerase
MTALPLSAHIGYLFTELPLEERIAAARKAGFDAIEHPQPFAIPADRMVAYLKAEGLTFSQMAAATGNASRGEKGLTALPGREANFRQALEQSLEAHPGFRGAGGGVRGVRPSCPMADYGFLR